MFKVEKAETLYDELKVQVRKVVDDVSWIAIAQTEQNERIDEIQQSVESTERHIQRKVDDQEAGLIDTEDVKEQLVDQGHDLENLKKQNESLKNYTKKAIDLVRGEISKLSTPVAAQEDLNKKLTSQMRVLQAAGQD